MEDVVIIASILGAIMIGVMTPGPSFLVISQVSLSTSRQNGVAVAAGMGVSGIIYGASALLGIHILLEQVYWAYLAFKIAGGGYLIYLAYKIWRGANEPIAKLDEDGTIPNRFFTSFLKGLTTQLTNPKTALVYASVFATFMKTEFDLTTSAVLLVLLFFTEFSWYALVAVTFSSPKPRGMYLAAKAWIDRTASFIICALGLKLILDR